MTVPLSVKQANTHGMTSTVVRDKHVEEDLLCHTVQRVDLKLGVEQK